MLSTGIVKEKLTRQLLFKTRLEVYQISRCQMLLPYVIIPWAHQMFLGGAGLDSWVHPAMSHCSSDVAEAVQVDGEEVIGHTQRLGWTGVHPALIRKLSIS